MKFDFLLIKLWFYSIIQNNFIKDEAAHHLDLRLPNKLHPPNVLIGNSWKLNVLRNGLMNKKFIFLKIMNKN